MNYGGGKSILSLTEPIFTDYLKYTGQDIIYQYSDGEINMQEKGYKKINSIIIVNDYPYLNTNYYKSNEKDNNKQTIYNYYIEKNTLYVILKLEINSKYDIMTECGNHQTYYCHIDNNYFYLMKNETTPYKINEFCAKYIDQPYNNNIYKALYEANENTFDDNLLNLYLSICINKKIDTEISEKISDIKITNSITQQTDTIKNKISTLESSVLNITTTVSDLIEQIDNIIDLLNINKNTYKSIQYLPKKNNKNK